MKLHHISDRSQAGRRQFHRDHILPAYYDDAHVPRYRRSQSRRREGRHRVGQTLPERHKLTLYHCDNQCRRIDSGQCLHLRVPLSFSPLGFHMAFSQFLHL